MNPQEYIKEEEQRAAFEKRLLEIYEKKSIKDILLHLLKMDEEKMLGPFAVIVCGEAVFSNHAVRMDSEGWGKKESLEQLKTMKSVGRSLLGNLITEEIKKIEKGQDVPA